MIFFPVAGFKAEASEGSRPRQGVGFCVKSSDYFYVKYSNSKLKTFSIKKTRFNFVVSLS